MDIGIAMPTMGITGGVRRVVEIANRLSMAGNNVTIYNEQYNNATWMKPVKLFYKQKRLADLRDVGENRKDIWLFGWPNFMPWVYEIVEGNKFFMIQHIEETWGPLILKYQCPTISFSTYANEFANSIRKYIISVISGHELIHIIQIHLRLIGSKREIDFSKRWIPFLREVKAYKYSQIIAAKHYTISMGLPENQALKTFSPIFNYYHSLI